MAGSESGVDTLPVLRVINFQQGMALLNCHQMIRSFCSFPRLWPLLHEKIILLPPPIEGHLVNYWLPDSTSGGATWNVWLIVVHDLIIIRPNEFFKMLTGSLIP